MNQIMERNGKQVQLQYSSHKRDKNTHSPREMAAMPQMSYTPHADNFSRQQQLSSQTQCPELQLCP